MLEFILHFSGHNANSFRKKLKKESYVEENLKLTVEAIQCTSFKMRATGWKLSIPESTFRGRMKQNIFEK